MLKGHTLIIGQTECGKTTLAKQLAKQYAKADIPIVVLDPLRDPEWPTTLVFTKSEAFFQYVRDPKECRKCALFVDEAGISLNRYDDTLQWLTTTSRHHGHRSHLLAQRAEMVNKTMRSQCGTLITFAINPKDAKEYALDFNCEDIFHKAPSLERFQYMVVSRFEKPTYHRLLKK